MDPAPRDRGWASLRAGGTAMQGQLMDRMRGRPLLLAEAFGIGPGEVPLGGKRRIRGCCLSRRVHRGSAAGRCRRPGSRKLGGGERAALNEAPGF